ncbi:MAG: mechanosensitive ion channel family protein, partial [Spirochaetes bacterium]|nr:mechanosensitive ion channel family protein [Spirochaetota bacterium]
AGEYLFTRETAARAKEFYEKVKHLPYLEGSGRGALYRGTWFEETVPAWMKESIVFLQIWQWAGLFLAILLGLMVKFVVKAGVDLVNRISARSSRVWFMKTAKAFSGPTSLLAATLFWYISYRLLGFDGGVQTFLRIVLQILLAGALLWLLYRLMGVFSDYLADVASRTPSTLDDKLVPIATRALRIFIVVFGALVAVQNMGLNVMSVLAGLGIGGLAFALAGKDMVANFFGSLMILFNGPFQVGDWIIVGSAEGTVEEIGFRTTRIRTFYNSVITIPNGELVIKEVDNMGRREYRRVMATVGVTYDTPPDLLREFIDGIKKIIADNPHSKKDAIYVVFNGYGDSSLDIMIYYFIKVPDWMTELEQKEDVFMKIFRLAAQLNVDFAFPTRTVHMGTDSGKKGAGGLPGEEDPIVRAGD